MKIRIGLILGLLLAATHLLSPPVLAQGTAFTYQGRLADNANAADGSYDFRFRLSSDALGNNYVGAPVFTNALPVNGGLFVVTLDFGAGIFIGSNYWLQVDVKTNGAGGYTTLTPLQKLTSTPYAIYAGTVAAEGLSGTYSSAVAFNNAGNSFTGNGTGLTNVSAATLGGISSAGFWKTDGNAGANPTNGAFLGTTDNLPLDIKVNGQRALRVESAIDPSYGPSPNLVGGFSGNIISNGVAGGVISGGGVAAAPNRVGNSFATVVGGFGNTASGFAATAGGNLSVASGGASTAMGSSTLASGGAATAMGQNSVASGSVSTAMGYGTTASGTYAMAMGLRAKANHNGTFVWGDSQNVDFTSTAANQFLVRAGGGVGINTNNPAGAALAVVGGIRAGVNGTVQSRVQFGTATVGTGTNGVNTFTITFPTAFAAAPKVFVMAKGNDNPDTFSISTRAVTAANFKVNVIRTDTAAGWGQSLQVDWYAVE